MYTLSVSFVYTAYPLIEMICQLPSLYSSPNFLPIISAATETEYYCRLDSKASLYNKHPCT